MRIKAFICGFEGLRLTPGEVAFVRREQPWGFILFARNIANPAQARELTDRLRDLAGRADVPILIDQEGGRVQRLKPPLWPAYLPGRRLGAIHSRDSGKGLRAAWLQSRLIAFDLAAIGVNVDCLPVLDVPQDGAHDVIGDRAYSLLPDEVARLGRAAAAGLIAGGVLPVIKHIPGHGRAMSDSHLALPRVDCPAGELGCTDFYPFMQLADLPLAMTAHVVYTAIDARRPATLSKKVLGGVVRGWMGYDGLVMSDDLSMQALSGDYSARTRSSFEAGCDIVLHCNGDMAQMEEIAAAAPVLKGDARRRADSALRRLNEMQPADEAALRAEYAELTAA
jgi:beta-N-acetylhexosaminidase